MNQAVKRAIDVSAALIGMIILAPPLAIVALTIRLKMGSPILFRQVRPGLLEQPFTMYKFRTMTNQHDTNGNLLSDDERLTSLGRFLRKASLDELPQLWNVLKGEMSLVGPRPLFAEYLPYYTDRERKRHTVRPGITGLAQISGRNHIPWDERLELDVQYVERQSLALDMAIIFKTAWKVIARSDIMESTTAEGVLAVIRGNMIHELAESSDIRLAAEIEG